MSLITELSTGYTLGPEQDVNLEIQRAVLRRTTLLAFPFAIFWISVYALFGESDAALVLLGFVGVLSVNVVAYRITGAFSVFRLVRTSVGLVFPALLMIALGDFHASSGIVLWAFWSPLLALLSYGPSVSHGWFAAFIAILAGASLVQPWLERTNNLPEGVIHLMFFVNFAGITGVAYLLLQSFMRQKDLAYELLRKERERSESLLLNVLPKEIASRLKAGEKVIADRADSTSILFADIVSFTPLSASISAEASVSFLDEVFSKFDALVDRYGLEKIRTIGDSYMVASGVPRARQDHAQAAANLALDMTAYIESLPPVEGQPIRFRIGIHSGPVVAGVIGRHKFHYDLWGDTVNIASRMESHGVPGKIQITEQTHDLLADDFVFERRGPIPVKGRGEMTTWFLEARA